MNLNLAVIGDLIIDRFIYYKSIRLSPEGPAPIVKRINNSEAIGGAGNVALSLINLGLNIKFYFPCQGDGQDNVENPILYLLNNKNLRKNPIFTKIENIIPIKIRYYVDDRQYMREDNELSNLNKISIISKSYIDEIILKNDLIVVADYQKGVFNSETLNYLIEACNKSKKPLFIDTKNRDPSSIKNAFCLKINKLEFNHVFNNYELLENDTNDQMKNKIKNAKLSHNIKNLVVTLGGEGSIAATNEEVIFSYYDFWMKK